MSEFGNDYRREVEDINTGKARITDTAKGISSGESMSGSDITRVETRGKREGMQALLGFASETLTGIHNKQQQEDFHKAYSASVEEAQSELDKADKETGLFGMMFGKNATQRGFHRRVLENETNTFHLQHLKRVKADAHKYKSYGDYYKKVLAPSMKAALDKQGDSEMRADIVKNFTRVAKNLGGQWTTHRAAYEQVLNRKATLDGVTGAIDVYRSVAETGITLKDAEGYKKSVEKAFTVPPEGMEPIAHQDTVVNAVMADLGQGNTHGVQILEDLQKRGKIDLDMENQEKLNLAKETWIRENDFNFQQKEFELDSLIAQQSKDFEPVLKAAQSKYGNSIRANDWRQKFQTVKLDNIAKAAELEQNIQSTINGEAVSGEEGRAARQAIQSRIGNALVMNNRKALLARQQADGTPPEEWVDMYKAATPEEMQNALLDNPDALLNTWAGSQTKLPIVTQSQVRLSTLLNQPRHSNDDVKEIERLNKFNRRFEKRDPYLYAKQATSKDELARNSSLTFLIESGMPPLQAVQQVREFSNRPDYTWDYENGEMDDAAEDVFDSAGDDLGFKFWSTSSMTPDNKEQAIWHSRRALEQATKIVKDPELAKVVARRYLLNNSARVGDQFIFDGAAVDKNSVIPTDNYYKLLNNDERWKDKYELAGFPRNRRLDDSMNKITPLPNGAGMTVSSESPVDGSYIFVVIPSPTVKADLPVLKGQNPVLDIYEAEQLENVKPLGQ